MPLADGQCFAEYTICGSWVPGGSARSISHNTPDCRAMMHSRCCPPSSPTTTSTASGSTGKPTSRQPCGIPTSSASTTEGVQRPAVDLDGLCRGHRRGACWRRKSQRHAARRGVRTVTAVAQALDYAHQRQLLHRDVKPANILLSHPDSDDERVLSGDFGIARWVDDASGLTGTNMTVGTVAYAAPEQLMGEQLDGRADQYALAATAFHLLTGTPLFSIRTRPSSSASTSPPIRRRSVPDARPCQNSDRCFPRRSPRRPRTATTRAWSSPTRWLTGSEWWPPRPALPSTAAVPITTGPKHRSRPQSRPQRAAAPPARRRPVLVVTVVLALLLIGVGSIGLLLLRAERQTPAQKPKPPSSAPATAASPVVPVVLVGADCATLGAAGVTSDGAQAYCSKLPEGIRCGPCSPRCHPVQRNAGVHRCELPGRHRGASRGVRRGDP